MGGEFDGRFKEKGTKGPKETILAILFKASLSQAVFPFA